MIDPDAVLVVALALVAVVALVLVAALLVRHPELRVWLAERRKAVVALLAPAVPLVLAALGDESAGGGAIVRAEWVAIVSTCLTAGGFVYGVRNRTKAPAGE